MNLETLIRDESFRCHAFPVAGERAFFAHAAVAPLPRAAEQAMREYAERGTEDSQESEWVWDKVKSARAAAAQLLECAPDEVALLGPTALGLSLVANGLPWQPGDEVVYYQDDYPANVYPWLALESRGVKAVTLRPKHPGAITWDLVQGAITPRTKLVALASCSFLSGYRVDVDEIGRNLRERGILFCVDGIQSLGAFPLSTRYVDFLSADSHKWLLGPVGAGVVYVRRERQELLRPSLVGAWNVASPHFVAQGKIEFYEGARRYEPGSLNLPGIVGMLASINLILSVGVEAIARRILELRRSLLELARPLGYRLYIEECDSRAEAADAERSGIVTLTHRDKDLRSVARNLRAAKVSISLRQNRAGEDLLRFSPHFYNTEEELERAVRVLAD